MSMEATITIGDLNRVPRDRMADHIADKLERVAQAIRQGFNAGQVASIASDRDEVLVSLPYVNL